MNKPSNKKSMGKGLSSLFNTSEIDSVLRKENKGDSANITEMPIDNIVPNPEQPRRHFDPTALEELTTSIKEVGIIEPIIIRKAGGKYELIAGERRWRAAKKAGLGTIPVVIKNYTDDDLLEIMLIENIQREDLSPIEEAQSYQLILNQKDITHEQLANRVGKSRGHITNLLRILNLPIIAKELLSEGKLTLSQAKVFLTYLKHFKEEDIPTIIDKGKELTIRDLEQYLKKVSKSPHQLNPLTTSQETQVIEPPTDPNLIALENTLRDKLKTKIRITPLKSGAGKIEIEYYDYNDLNGIIDRL